MFGKHFASLYEGSMVGSGAVVFAVWGFVIAKQVPDRVSGSQVRLNAKLLSTILGEPERDVAKAIQFLCSPDPNSTTPDKEGRRLIKIGEFDYQVVNGARYRAIRDENMRREQNRLAQERYRAKSRKHGGPGAQERAYEMALENGAPEAVLDKMSEPQTPRRHPYEIRCPEPLSNV